MFISTLDLFRIGIGPSSSHTIGPMRAAFAFVRDLQASQVPTSGRLRCRLQGSLALTGKGHASDTAVLLGLHGYQPAELTEQDVDSLLTELRQREAVSLPCGQSLRFNAVADIVFDGEQTPEQHPNGMLLQVLDGVEHVRFEQQYFSLGGGFIATAEELAAGGTGVPEAESTHCPYPFASAKQMLAMAEETGLSIAAMKRCNEVECRGHLDLDRQLERIWQAMRRCVRNGLASEGELPGELHIQRRAAALYRDLRRQAGTATLNDWLSAYAMAVNEENAAGHMVVTAPTNGAAGVISAVLYYLVEHQQLEQAAVHDFLLTAAAIGGLIKHRSSISGAEVGCQGEVGSAAAMAAAGACAVRGGTPRQVENAAEIALEHHLGMTCDPVAGLVQVPCIERNAFGAVKAYTAAALALRGSGQHFMSLDSCISAMRETGLEMSRKYKETSLGGLAVSFIEC